MVLSIMPRKHEPLTLKQTCINVTARCFDRLWGEEFERQFGSMPLRLMYVIGPFSDLPGHICEEILHTLEATQMLRSTHLHLLVVPQITRIKFSPTSASSLINQALMLLSYRCKRLTSLDLSNCRSVSSQSLSKFLPVFTSLRVLILKQTKAKSAILKIIATHLPRLLHLDLQGCPVTDSDALLLSGDNGDFDPVCKNLVLLDISGTKIELTGCIAILRCFPNLRFLTFPDTMEAVALLHKNEAPAPSHVNSATKVSSNCEPSTSAGGTSGEKATSVPENCHKLEALHASAIRCRKINPNSVQTACYYCPYVKEVLWYHDATDESLKHLLCLQHLNVLEVCGDHADGVTFHCGVKPLLVSRGAEMVGLGLYNIQSIDLGDLGYLCPKLQRLKVVSLSEDADFAQSYLTTRQQAESYKALLQLMLALGSHHTQFDPSDLLIRSQALEKLHLIGVLNLTDQVLLAAFNAHGFACLKELQLESCDQVTVSSVTKLVTSCDLLTHVSLKECELITRQDADQLERLITVEALGISVEWR